MLIKYLAIVGLFFTAIGTILLWRSSPAGYIPGSYYLDEETTKEVVKNNNHMARGQKIAIVLILAGSALQTPSVIYG